MRDLLLLLVLLNAQTAKVCSKPYKANSDGTCHDPTTEYLPDGSNLCCKKCRPGHRLKEECTETTETVCEQCPRGQYMESWNYFPNCNSCNKCTPRKGLEYSKNCSSTTRSTCVCQPGRYCSLEFDDPFCSDCKTYKLCKAGYGVSLPGTANSDVKCERCPDGTFSDRGSYTDPCLPHTNCHGRVVVRKGSTTSDTVCAAFGSSTQPQTSSKEPHAETVFITASTMMSTVSATSDSTPSVSHLSSDSLTAFNHSTKSPPQSPVSDSKLVAAIASVMAVLILIFIGILLLVHYKPMKKKDAARFHPKVDANGNCESGDKISRDYLGENQLTSFKVTSPEQQCLLEKGEACIFQSQCSNNTETLTKTDGCSSHESIGPLLSTIALHNPCSALSEPMTLLSNTEPVIPQPSVPTQSSSQPTSQPIISPVTTSPHVNVNITFHIGNGSGGTPSVLPTDLMQVDSKLPFGEEEESFSIPQQEAGKQSLMSVQESASYSV